MAVLIAGLIAGFNEVPMQTLHARKITVALLVGLGVACVFSGCHSFTQSFSPKETARFIPSFGPQSDGVEEQLDPEYEAEIILATANHVGSQGHFTEAIRLYEKALTLTPQDLSIDLKLAPLYAESGNMDAALRCYQKCMDKGHEDPEFINNFAWSLMQAERLQEAESLASKTLKKHPDSKQLVSTLAMIQYRLGNPEAALDLFTRAYGEAAAHHNLAILEIDSGKVDEAKPHLQRALELHSEPSTIALAKAVGL